MNKKIPAGSRLKSFLEKDPRRGSRDRCLATGSLVNLGIVVFSLFFWRGGYYGAFASYFQGGPLVVPPTISIGEVEGGRQLSLSVPLANASHEPVKIIGSQTSCFCTSLTSLPVSLGPGERRSLKILISTIGKSGPFDSRVELFMDCPRSQMVSFRIVGTIIPTISSGLPSH